MRTVVKFSLVDKKILRPIFNFAKPRKAKLYLVGGVLRDLLLARQKENPDFDFCLKTDAISFGRKLAAKIRAGFVVLDKEHGACRLVKKIKGRIYTFDFTDFRGQTLEEDLLHRDFTIDALALELENALKQGNLHNSLIDPWAGRSDLGRKIIKAVNKEAFSEDPLRILRAFSFSSILGFKIDRGTLSSIKSEKNKLSEVSGERIRDELFKLLDKPQAFNYLVMLDELKILKIIFPEIEKMRGLNQGPYHHLDVLHHSLETVRQLEGLIKETENKREIQDYLNECISADRKRRALIKFAAFLHDIGKPLALRRENGKLKFHGHERIGCEIAENIAGRLRLSGDELNALHKMILWHLRPGYMADIEELSPRAKFRYFRDTNREAVSTLLLSIADQRATKGALTTPESRIRHERIVFGLLKEYFKSLKEKKLPRLINGYDLLKKFKLQPSPLIGKILSEVEELQAIGKIKTKTDALKIAEKIVRKQRSI